MDIAAGSVLRIEGRQYQVGDRLGGGSQGQVFQGQADDGSQVALKFITDPRRRHREADILRGWSSEHVVGLKGQGQWESGEVLVMDLVDGLTLQRLQEMCARLERGLHPALALELIAQVASGLEEGYRTLRLKVHRDIKPSNLMLGRDGRGKILDFGIAYGLDLTCTGTPVATPLYMAPEQMEGARPAEELDHRTDQYSLGLLLAELVLGRPLRPMERDALARWLFVPGAELDAARDQVGRQAPEVLPALERMLAWEPDDRFGSMGEAVEALREALANCTGPEPLSSFAQRLITLKDRGQLLDRSDPALRPLKGARPRTSETILPDMTADLPAFKPRVLSPAMERTGPVNLADLRILGTAPQGLGAALVTEARPAQALVESLPPQRGTLSDSAAVTTHGWYRAQSRRRRAATGVGLMALVVGAAAIYWGGGGDRPEAGEELAAAPARFASVEAPPVVHRERRGQPILPVSGRGAPSAKGAAHPSEGSAKAAPPAEPALSDPPEARGSAPAAPEEHASAPAAPEEHASAPAAPAHRPPAQDWRGQSQVLQFEGDSEVPLPSEVITDRRPGIDIDDQAEGGEAAAVDIDAGDEIPEDAPAAEMAPVDTASVDTAPVDTAPVDTVPVDTAAVDTATTDAAAQDAADPADVPEAVALVAAEAAGNGGAPADAPTVVSPVPAPPPQLAAAEPSLAEQLSAGPHLSAADASPGRALSDAPPAKDVAASLGTSPGDAVVAMAPLPRSIPGAAPGASGAAAPAISEGQARAAADPGADVPQAGPPEAEVQVAAAPPAADAAQEPAAPAPADEEIITLPHRPSSFTDRQWARQLVSMGLLARNSHMEAQARAYFDAAQATDPGWDVPAKALAGELDRLPPAEPAPAPAPAPEQG